MFVIRAGLGDWSDVTPVYYLLSLFVQKFVGPCFPIVDDTFHEFSSGWKHLLSSFRDYPNPHHNQTHIHLRDI